MSLDLSLRLVPLINVIFLLLIFFMLTATPMTQAAHGVALPSSYQGNPVVENTLRIVLPEKGAIRMGVDSIADKDLTAVLKTALMQKSEKNVTILADKNASASRVLVIMRALEKAGGASVQLVTEQP